VAPIERTPYRPDGIADTPEADLAKLDTQNRNELDTRKFAFPRQRKEPIEDARHVRNAIARFDQVKEVSDAERDEAWLRIKAAAETFGVAVHEGGWRELGKQTA
jgi:hypothetical protein